jgi:hypothetical protein
LSPEEIDGFHRLGFLAIADFTSLGDIRRVRRILLRLYARFGNLPRQHAIDLGDVAWHEDAPRIAEINWALRLAPQLRSTMTFVRCWGIAEQLMGCPLRYTGYDHAILKPPRNGSATAWHQDAAYKKPDAEPSIHFWVPLHDVTVDMGCMQFIPGSHRGPLLPHRPRDPRAHALEAVGVDDSTAVACPLPAGGATVHLSRTLHYTGPNATDEPRLAWSLEFAPPRPRRWRLPFIG